MTDGWKCIQCGHGEHVPYAPNDQLVACASCSALHSSWSVSAAKDRQRRDWQPIASAPKDGTRVDLWVVGYTDEPVRITNAFFSSGHWWYSENHEIFNIDPGTPTYPVSITHWMALPEPPAKAIEARQGGDGLSGSVEDESAVA